MRRGLLAFLVVPLVSACATYVDSEPDPNGTRLGLRYSLPAPFLVITPQSDGTLKTSIEMLPDPNRTYVLRTRSFLSSYTLDVQLENQMLKSVSFNGDGTSVANQIAESAGTLGAARIEAAEAARTERREEREAAREARQSAQEALREAELNLEIAEATYAELQAANAAADVLLQARLQVTEARVRRDAALRAGRRSPTSLSSANAPHLPPEGGPVAAGPMIFRIVPDGQDGVRLVGVRGPNMFRTSLAAQPAVAPGAWAHVGALPVRPDPAGDLKFDATYNRTVVAIRTAEVFSSEAPVTPVRDLAPAAILTAAGAGTKISFVLDRATPAGDYTIIVEMDVRGQTGTIDRVSAQLNIQVFR